MNLIDLRSINLVGRITAFFDARKGNILRSIMVVAGGTALSQVLIVIASPILTRLYDPASFGIFTLYLSISQIFLTFISLRYELAISLPKDDIEGAQVSLFAIMLVTANAFMIGVLIYFFSDNLLVPLNLVHLRPYLWVIPIALLGAGIYQVLGYWAIRRKAYGLIARTTFAKNLTTIIFQLASGLLGWLSFGLIFGDFIGRFVGSGTFGKSLLHDNKERINEITLTGAYKQAYRYRNFALFSTPATLIDRLALYLPSLMLAAFFAPQIVGWFGLGQQVIAAPINLVGDAVSQVYLGEASVFLRESPEKIRGLFLRFARDLFLLGVLPTLSLAVFGSWLLGFFYGANWSEAGLYIQVLAPSILLQFVVSPLSITLNMLEKQSWQFLWNVGFLLLVAISMYYAWSRSFGAVGVVIAFSMASLVAYVVLFLMMLWTIFKLEIMKA